MLPGKVLRNRVRKVLFVCVHNAGRSQMAEAMLNRMASERGLSVRAESAGTLGGKAIHSVAAQAMEEIGVSMEGQRPKPLTQAAVDSAERVVTMGCGVDAEACPAKFLVSDDWGLDDPAGQPIEKVREIRDAIRLRVEALLEEMAL